MAKFRTRLIGAVLAAAVAAVGGYEGLRTKAYKDPVGVPTICYGETLGVKLGQVKTVAECKAMLKKRLVQFEQGMSKCIVNPENIPDKSYIAFLSLTYNIGTGGFCKSTLVKKLNKNDLIGACNEIPKFNRAGGKVLKGLTERRATEKKTCLEGALEGRIVGINDSPNKEPASAPVTHKSEPAPVKVIKITEEPSSNRPWIIIGLIFAVIAGVAFLISRKK